MHCMQWRSKTNQGPKALDNFATKANEALLGAAVTAASFLARAGAKAAEHVPQLSEEEKNQKMSLGGRAVLASASTVASVAAFAAGGTMAKGAKVVTVAKSANDLRGGAGSGKLGVAMSAVQRTGLANSLEADEIKRASSSTVSNLFASLSEAADIVAAGANKGVAEAVGARYGRDVAERVSKSLPGDKNSAVLLPEPEVDAEVDADITTSNPALSTSTELVSPPQEASMLPTAELQPEPQSQPETRARPADESQPETASNAHQKVAAFTTALVLRSRGGDPAMDQVVIQTPHAGKLACTHIHSNNTCTNFSVGKFDIWLAIQEILFRRCSWCSEHTTHTLKTRKKIRRSIYTCSGCMKDTLPCKSCDKKHPNIELGASYSVYNINSISYQVLQMCSTPFRSAFLQSRRIG